MATATEIRNWGTTGEQIDFNRRVPARLGSMAYLLFDFGIGTSVLEMTQRTRAFRIRGSLDQVRTLFNPDHVEMFDRRVENEELTLRDVRSAAEIAIDPLYSPPIQYHFERLAKEEAANE